MTDPIRTPLDEVTEPGHFYPPFREGWTYHGATYPGHSDFAVDWNRRTPDGAWKQDDGDPVLAAADGTVKTVTAADGLVIIGHKGGYATEYRHMRDILVRPRQRVERGDRIGSIGNVAGSGSSFGPHLHHRHYRSGKPIQMRFEGKPVLTSVGDSDSKPPTWDPPAPVAVVGPPPRATWRSAFEEAVKRLQRTERKLASAETARGAAEAALHDEQAAHQLARTAAEELSTSLVAANARIRELENAPPPLDAQTAALVAALGDRDIHSADDLATWLTGLDQLVEAATGTLGAVRDRLRAPA